MSNKNSAPFVSVIVPVYNAANFLDECLSSIASQTMQNWECILINDGSTDGSLELCKKWTDIDDRICLIDQKNQGVSVARNKGIMTARGKYLYFLDADDWCETEIFPKDEASDIIIGEYYVENCNRTEYVPFLAEPLDNYGLTFLSGIVKSCMGTYFVKKELVISNSILYDSRYRYGEDMSFTLRCLLNAKTVKYDRRPYFHYRKNGGSATSKWTFARFDVFFSWLPLVNYAQMRGNYEVAKFINEKLLIETAIYCSRDLLREGVSTKDIKTFYKMHPEIVYYLNNAATSQIARKDIRYASALLNHIVLFSLYIKMLYAWYDIHASLGRIKNKLLNN